MIKIIDYGMGNAHSIKNIIKKAGFQAEICTKANELNNSKIIILPGVGSFDNAIIKLRALDFVDSLNYYVLKKKITFLGICLGMQVLFEKSEEGILPGFGWIKGNVTRFNFSNLSCENNLKVPHMGWNTVQPKSHNDLFCGLYDEARFYFIHSFHANCFNDSNILATTNYGYEFVCSVNFKNIWGVQFHPEKSHLYGASFFKNFINKHYA